MPKSILSAALILAAFMVPAQAESVICRVADPTGTPLNIRLQPDGEIVATVRTGESILVFKGDEKTDGKGRLWLSMALKTSSAPDGYVLAAYVKCP